MVSKRHIRVGLIGAGYISGYHLAGLRATGEADVCMIAGRSRDRVARVAHEYAVPESVTDYRMILDRADIDAVVIATPDHTHEAIAIAAAQAGKAILLQKPMARTTQECRRIIDAARRTGVCLSVSFMHRYLDEVIKLRELLTNPRVGQVQAVRIRNATPGADWNDWFFSLDYVAGGVVMQLGVHGIDLVQHLFGPIATVTASTSLLRGTRKLADGRTVNSQCEDHANAIYRFASGIEAVHDMSYSEVQGCDRFRLEIYCADATIWLRTERGLLSIYAPALTGKKAWVVPEFDVTEFGARHHAHWLAVVRKEAADDTTAEDGLATIQVAEAIYRSAASRCEETIEEPDNA